MFKTEGGVVKVNTKQKEGGVSEERERKIRGERGGEGGRKKEKGGVVLSAEGEKRRVG